MTSSLDTFRAHLAPELQALNEHIAAALSSPNELLNKVIDNYLTVKGKQIRPVIVILSSRLFGADAATAKRVISAAAAVEMLHNASLIHDDVVDQSAKRRGLPTINNVWDNHIAVLVGDFFVSSSLHEAISTGDLRIVDALARLGRLLSVGEMDQIFNARFHKLSEEGYFGVIGRKTASLFVACAEMGAYATGVASDDPRLAALRRYAELLGLCFQIKDDIFDYFDEGRLGKPTGNDLREGKVTLPLLHALTAGDDSPERRAMLELSRKEVLDKADIDSLIAYARARGGIEYAYATMERLHAEARPLLNVFPNDCEAASALEAIFDFVISREY